MHFHRGIDNRGGDLVHSESRDDGWAGHSSIFSPLLRAWL
jgi:hypothetical protein